MNIAGDFILKALQEEVEYEELYKLFHSRFPWSIHAFEIEVKQLIDEGKVKLWQNPVTQQFCLYRQL